MNSIPNQFLIDINELLQFCPEHPFTKDDIEIINLLHIHQKNPQEALIALVEAAQNLDEDKVSKLSFYTKDTWEPLLKFVDKINKNNCNHLLKLATYAFNEFVSIELNEKLEPINIDNIIKLQAYRLNCIPHIECTIITPSSVSIDDVLFKFQSAATLEDIDNDFSAGNIFQYYLKNTPLNELIPNVEDAPDFIVDESPTNFLDVFKIDKYNILAIRHAIDIFDKYNKNNNNISMTDFALLVNPDLQNMNPNILLKNVNTYMDSKFTLNNKKFKDFTNFSSDVYNDPQIAQTLNSLLVSNPKEIKNIFFENSPLGNSLTSKIFLDKLENIRFLILKEPNPISSLIDKNLKFLSKDSDDFDLPRAKLNFHKLSVWEQNLLDNTHSLYINNFLENFDPKTTKPQSIGFPLFVLYPYLKDEHRSNHDVVQAIVQTIRDLYPTNIYSNALPFRQIEIYSQHFKNFLSYMPINTFKDMYPTIFQDTCGYPKFKVACYFEIENSLQEILSNKGTYSQRPLQDEKTFKDIVGDMNLQDAINYATTDKKTQKLFPVLNQLSKASNGKAHVFFFQKFCEEYNPLHHKIKGHNQLCSLFGEAILHNQPEAFQQFFNITKDSILSYLEHLNVLSAQLKDIIVNAISNIDWDVNNDEEMELFQNTMTKLGKKSVLKLTLNPKTHPVFKAPKNMQWLQTRAFFTNGASENYKLPMQHMFTIDEIAKLYEQYPDKEFIKISPFTFIPLAPMQYKSDPNLWINLMNDKSKTSILQFMPLSLKNNPEILVKMLKDLPNKTEPILSHFSNEAIQNISVFMQVISNMENNSSQKGTILRIYSSFIEILCPGIPKNDINFSHIKTICEELIMSKIIPINKTNTKKAFKF